MRARVCVAAAVFFFFIIIISFVFFFIVHVLISIGGHCQCIQLSFVKNHLCKQNEINRNKTKTDGLLVRVCEFLFAYVFGQMGKKGTNPTFSHMLNIPVQFRRFIY